MAPVLKVTFVLRVLPPLCKGGYFNLLLFPGAERPLECQVSRKGIWSPEITARREKNMMCLAYINEPAHVESGLVAFAFGLRGGIEKLCLEAM